MTTKREPIDVYATVTDKIISQLEAGTVPWQKPWLTTSPMSLSAKRAYRGINVLLLGISAAENGYTSPYWVTFRQAKKIGGNVRKGEKSTLVVLWKWIDREKENDQGETETYRFPILRYFRVFNTNQCDLPEGIVPELKNGDPVDPIEEAETMINAMPQRPPIKNGGERACYSPLADTVQLPPRDSFTSSESYYGTVFHELAHSTGHESRLGRFKSYEDTTEVFRGYGAEELVAEMASAFLAATVGIDTEAETQRSAAYMQNWMKSLKNDPKMVVLAASRAQKAADWILDRRPEVN